MKRGDNHEMGLRKIHRKPISLLWLIPFILATLACGATVNLPQARLVFGRLPATATVTAITTSTATPIPTTATPTPTVSFTATPAFKSTTTLGPAFTPVEPTVRIANQVLQINVFTQLWTTIRDNYLYADFNGLDWNAIFEEYHDKIIAGMRNEDFYQAMDEMIGRLGDEHSIYFSPEQVFEEDARFSGQLDYVGIGVLTISVPERSRITIIQVFPGSPAEAAGLQIHDSILAVDGEPILDENGDRLAMLRGPIGSDISITVLSPGQGPRQVKVERNRIDSELPVYSQVFTSPEGKRIGYIQLTTFDDETIPRKVRRALQSLASGGRLHGLILDNRYNEGGANTVFENVLAYFKGGRLGFFVDRSGDKEALSVEGRNISGSQQVPLVVLVGKDTASFGEIFSGILKDTQRAYLIGQTTDGNVEILYAYEFTDGSRAWIAHDRFQPLNHPEQDWEESGIIPNQTVTSNWDEVTEDTDPLIKAALEHFDQ